MTMDYNSKGSGRYLTVRQTCEELHIGVTTLYRMLGRGDLTRHKVGHRVLIRRADVDALVARGADRHATSAPPLYEGVFG